MNNNHYILRGLLAGQVAVITGAGSATGIGFATPSELEAGAATPNGRSGTPDGVAALVSFLATPDASYLTAQLLVIGGGNCVIDDKVHHT